MIATPRGSESERPRRFSRGPALLGRPFERGVIVLTVKLFGETLEAPRTLAVWQWNPARSSSTAEHRGCESPTTHTASVGHSLWRTIHHGKGASRLRRRLRPATPRRDATASAARPGP
ncbi:hypothetical protein BU197_23870 [Streptomyces sp. CBMA291]|nr:hypothetical protein [Streptomyces sp. CBMA291]MBD0716378.1 hypothetical protein [Streptomyces sp. CBMA370]